GIYRRIPPGDRGAVRGEGLWRVQAGAGGACGGGVAAVAGELCTPRRGSGLRRGRVERGGGPGTSGGREGVQRGPRRGGVVIAAEAEIRQASVVKLVVAGFPACYHRKFALIWNLPLLVPVLTSRGWQHAVPLRVLDAEATEDDGRSRGCGVQFKAGALEIL